MKPEVLIGRLSSYIKNVHIDTRKFRDILAQDNKSLSCIEANCAIDVGREDRVA